MDSTLGGMMDSTLGSSAIVAKQRSHARHAPLIAEASPLPQTLMAQSLVDGFEQQVALRPQHTAVVAAEGTLTYAALNGRANQLAHHLLKHGVAVDTPITVILERSLHSLVSIFAILKIGGHYLCLEPSLPAPRAQDILTRAATQTLLTTRDVAAYAAEIAPPGCTLLFVDEIPANVDAQNLDINIGPQNFSRLGFTSGSTGTPKANYKTHESYLYGAWQSSNAYLLGPSDRHGFVYPFSAGPSMRATFSALLTGGAVHLHPLTNYDMNSWGAWVEAEEITQLYMPTAAFRELLHARTGSNHFPSVRMVYVGGQTIYRHDAELFQQRFCQGAILVSRYSMSETSGLAHYLVDHDTQLEGETLPIGYALPGRELTIVDDAGQTVNFDQPGEIAVRRLFPSTAGEEAEGEGTTFFRTADLGLMRPDGCLIHLGRKDDMVKVRGNRVALSEAENLLLKVPGVAQAAVRPFPAPSGDNRLIGYVVTTPDTPLTGADVRQALTEFAPSYMVPARILVLPAMPLTTSGKVDRKALPPPALTRPQLATPFVEPRTELEQQIAELWGELLGVDTVGVEDNFFELGGDSITAMRMILRVEKLTQQTTPQDYFRTPTIANFAAPSLPATTPEPSPTPRRAAAPSLWARLMKGDSHNLLHNVPRALINQRLMALPYEQGIAWLRWLGQPTLAQRLFRQERAWFTTLAHELGNGAAATDDAFGLSVLGNLMRHNFQRSWLHRRPANGDLLKAMSRAPERFWRTFAEQFEGAARNQRAPLYHFNGLEHLVHAQKRKRGTILLTYHGVASALANVILARQTNLGRIPTISLERAAEVAEQDWGEEEGEFKKRDSRAHLSTGWAATYALQAQRILHSGGVVRIVNDLSYDAPNSLPKTIGQRHYLLKPGFAELALTTGAAVLPVYSTFDAMGGIHLTLLPALPYTATDDVQGLLDGYVSFLETTWRSTPESVGWGSLARYNQRPHARVTA